LFRETIRALFRESKPVNFRKLFSSKTLRLSRKFPKLFLMEAKEIAKELGMLAKRLAELASQLSPLESNVVRESPEFAYVLMLEKTCLRCKKPIEEGQKQVRGNHEACYKLTKDEVDNKNYTMADAERRGLLAPHKKPGRKKKPVDEAILRQIRGDEPLPPKTATEDAKPSASPLPEKD
jgi:hypothetical protein